MEPLVELKFLFGDMPSSYFCKGKGPIETSSKTLQNHVQCYCFVNIMFNLFVNVSFDLVQ